MSGHWCWMVLVVSCGLLAVSSAAPVEADAESLAKLAELKNQLKALEQNIDTFVGTEHSLNNAGKRQMEEQQGTKLASFMESLSPEDKALLKHMKSKASFLQAVLDEPQLGPNPGEEGPVKKSEVPEASVSEVDGQADEALQQFSSHLTPEDVKLLKKMKSKMQYLQGVLHEPPQELDPSERDEIPDVPSEKKRAYTVGNAPSIPLDQDDLLTDFMAHMSDDGIQMLKKNQNRLRYLQTAVHEPAGQVNPGEELDNEATEKRSDISEDVEPHPTHPAANHAAQGQKVAAPAHAAPQIQKQIDFTAADRAMLLKIESKLDKLQQQLEIFKKMELLKAKMEEMDAVDERRIQAHMDGTFGSFVDTVRKKKKVPTATLR